MGETGAELYKDDLYMKSCMKIDAWWIWFDKSLLMISTTLFYLKELNKWTQSYQSLNEMRARKWNENEALVSLSPLMWSCWWKSCNACVLYNCVMCASWSNFNFFAYFRTKVRLECFENVPILLERPLRAQNKKKAIHIFWPHCLIWNQKE